MNVTVINPLTEAFFVILTKTSLAWYSAITMFIDKAIRSKVWVKQYKGKNRRLPIQSTSVPIQSQKYFLRKSSAVCAIYSFIFEEFILIILFFTKSQSQIAEK